MRHLVILSIALGGLLAIAACTPSTTNAPTGSPSTTSPAGTPILVRDFALDPGALTVTAGAVAMTVTNDGPTVHNVKIRDGAGAVRFGSADLREGESETTIGTLEPGDYVLFCSLAGHESLGIKGTLTVTAP